MVLQAPGEPGEPPSGSRSANYGAQRAEGTFSSQVCFLKWDLALDFGEQ